MDMLQWSIHNHWGGIGVCSCCRVAIFFFCVCVCAEFRWINLTVRCCGDLKLYNVRCLFFWTYGVRCETKCSAVIFVWPSGEKKISFMTLYPLSPHWLSCLHDVRTFFPYSESHLDYVNHGIIAALVFCQLLLRWCGVCYFYVRCCGIQTRTLSLLIVGTEYQDGVREGRGGTGKRQVTV